VCICVYLWFRQGTRIEIEIPELQTSLVAAS